MWGTRRIGGSGGGMKPSVYRTPERRSMSKRDWQRGVLAVAVAWALAMGPTGVQAQTGPVRME